MIILQVVVPKAKGEILGVVIVESGWGSMLPTIVLANLLPSGPAARCGQLNIGDQVILWKKKKAGKLFSTLYLSFQVIAINGISLVGLPLSTCQTYIKVSHYLALTEQQSTELWLGNFNFCSLASEVDLERKQLVDLWIFYGRKSSFSSKAAVEGRKWSKRTKTENFLNGHSLDFGQCFSREIELVTRLFTWNQTSELSKLFFFNLSIFFTEYQK